MHSNYNSNWTILGQIGAKHGLRGFFKTRLYIQDLNLVECKKLWLLNVDYTTNQAIQVKQVNPYSQGEGMCLCLFKMSCPVKVLTMKYIALRKDDLPKLQSENEYYYCDLLGMQLRDTQNQQLGTVVEVEDFGSSTLLEVKLNHQADTVYLPLHQDLVLSVDNKHKNIIINSDSYWYKAIQNCSNPQDS